uniref:Uncharacterized protein n=1 Tax=Sphaerodactylus townsendi TaxID=933632 RepID=A0ACB8F8X9_9SAUR
MKDAQMRDDVEFSSEADHRSRLASSAASAPGTALDHRAKRAPAHLRNPSLVKKKGNASKKYNRKEHDYKFVRTSERV